MMAIVDPRRDVDSFKWDFTPKMIDAVAAEGDSPPYYSTAEFIAAVQRMIGD